MARIECIKCGATAISKNPATRSVFLDDQNEAILSHFFKFPKIENGRATGTITMVADTKEEYFTNLLSLLKLLEKVGVEQYCCEHEWKLCEGEEYSV